MAKGQESYRDEFFTYPDYFYPVLDKSYAALDALFDQGYTPFDFQPRGIANLPSEYTTRRGAAAANLYGYSPIQDAALAFLGNDPSGALRGVAGTNLSYNGISPLMLAMPDIRYATAREGMAPYATDYADRIIDPVFSRLEEDARTAQTNLNLQAMAQKGFGGSRVVPFATQTMEDLNRNKAEIAGKLYQDQYKTAAELARADVDRLLSASTEETKARSVLADLERQFSLGNLQAQTDEARIRSGAAEALMKGDIETARLLDSIATNSQRREQSGLDYLVGSAQPFMQREQSILDALFNLQDPQYREYQNAYDRPWKEAALMLDAFGKSSPFAVHGTASREKTHTSTLAKVLGTVQTVAGIAGSLLGGGPLAALGPILGAVGAAAGGGGGGGSVPIGTPIGDGTYESGGGINTPISNFWSDSWYRDR